MAPPYDVISEAQAHILRESDPHNVIRLILGKGNEGLHTDEEYGRAAATLAVWRRDGVLTRDEAPGLFLVEQTFRVGRQVLVRRGLLCAALLEDAGTGRLLPHEQTREGPRADRLRLMTACRASLSPVFGIFHDEGGAADDLLTDLAKGWPLYEFRVDEVAYRVWRVSDAERVRLVAEALAEEQLLIADGHHRYEVALAYRREHRDPALPPGRAAEDYLLLYCVSAHNPGLTILPTHRLVKAPEGFDREQFLRDVSATFLVEKVPAMKPEEFTEFVRTLGPRSMVCYAGPGQVVLLTDHGLDPLSASLPERPRQWRKLPVTLLHYTIMEPLLGIPAESATVDERVLFTPDAEQVYWSVEGKRYDLAFLLPPTRISTVEAIAQAGERMPPKSTYFYPKIPSGLAIYPFENGDGVPVLPPL